MAKRYICHLYFVELPDGKTEVTYGEPAHDVHARPVDIIGPEPLQVPDHPQTQDEHNEWHFWRIKPNGPCTMRFYNRPADLPAIEEEEVPEGPPECARLKVTLEAYQRPGHPKTLLVLLNNTGIVPISKLSVHWVSRNETPQRMEIRNVPALELGGSMSLMRPSSFDGALQVNEEISFLLDETALDPILGQVGSLSPERYWIAIASGESEFLRIDGRIVGDFLEKLDDKPVTYQFVPPATADDNPANPEAHLGGFDDLKKQYPSLELFTITVPNPEDFSNSGALLNGISPFMGKVNASRFEGRSAGTVMFIGPKAASGDRIAKLIFLYRPECWNREFRNETGRWEEVVSAETREPRYAPTDFGPLANMRIKGWH